MKDDSETKVMGCVMMLLGAPVLIGGLLAVSALINAWTLQKLWTWFVVPQFGLAPLSLPVAVGLGSIAWLMQPMPDTRDREGEEALKKWGRLLGWMVLKPALYLLTGYIALKFV